MVGVPTGVKVGEGTNVLVGVMGVPVGVWVRVAVGVMLGGIPVGVRVTVGGVGVTPSGG